MEASEYTQEMLARLPREELRRMLTEELQKDTQQIDDAFVRLLLAELQARGADATFTDDEEVIAACEKFRAATQISNKYRYRSWMLKIASVVLVLGVLFFALPAAAEAKNTSDVLTWWSDSLFQLFRPGSRPNVEEYVFETDHPGLQQIYDAVTEAGIITPIVPSELGDNFILTELKTLSSPEDASIHSRLTSDYNEILFTVITHSQQAMLQHEKKSENIAVWNIAGIDHYVIANTDMFIITWAIDNIECTVTTDCPEDDIYKLIYSIYYMSED